MAQQTDADDAAQTDDDGGEFDIAPTYEYLVEDGMSDRAVRAREQPMVVLPQIDHDGTCLGMYEVVTFGGQYTVEPTEGACECPDHQYNRPDGGCKHLRRVRLMLDHGLPARGEDSTRFFDAIDCSPGYYRRQAAKHPGRADGYERFAETVEDFPNPGQ